MYWVRMGEGTSSVEDMFMFRSSGAVGKTSQASETCNSVITTLAQPISEH